MATSSKMSKLSLKRKCCNVLENVLLKPANCTSAPPPPPPPNCTSAPPPPPPPQSPPQSPDIPTISIRDSEGEDEEWMRLCFENLSPATTVAAEMPPPLLPLFIHGGKNLNNAQPSQGSSEEYPDSLGVFKMDSLRWLEQIKNKNSKSEVETISRISDLKNKLSEIERQIAIENEQLLIFRKKKTDAENMIKIIGNLDY